MEMMEGTVIFSLVNSTSGRNSYMNLDNHIGRVIQIKCQGNKETPAGWPGLQFSRRYAFAEDHPPPVEEGPRPPRTPGRTGRRNFEYAAPSPAPPGPAGIAR